MTRITVSVNGKAYTREVADHQNLLHFLREDLGLIGTKEGCGAGECGACTVFFDGRTVNACMVLAVEADGRSVETIEGEADQGKLSRIQEAFHKHHAVQCGFCTAGMILSTRELLKDNPKPTVEEIKDGIEGNFCRCTGYQQIIEAVLDASGQSDKKGELKHA
jgi:carbon-monoxide dehydrogenase small subunit